MPDEHIEKTATLRPCPSCSREDYEYADAASEVIARFFGSLKEVSWSNLPTFGLRSLFDTSRSFMREVVQGIQATPLLICRHCRNFVAICPKCETYFIPSKYPSLGEIINCPTCKFGFCTCERSAELDLLLNKNPYWSWISKAIVGFIGAIILAFILFHLSVLTKVFKF